MALQIAIVVFLSSWSLCIQPAKARTFSSLNEIRGNGSLLVNVISPDDGITDKFVLFPNMMFNCPGRIEKVKYLTSPSLMSSDNTMFGLGWLKEDENIYKVKAWLPKTAGKNGTLFEQSYYSTHMNYKPGDVFAMQLSHKVLINMDKTIELLGCFMVHEHGPQMYRCIMRPGYQPLVTIETDHLECISGFVGDDVLEYIMRSTELTAHPSQQHLQPLPVISCSGVSINKWIVGARASLEVPPQIRLCDFCKQWLADFSHQLPCDFEYCNQLSTFNTTSYLNVYEHEPSSSFTQNGSEQFLAMINSFQIYYYQRCSLEDCIYRPLVAVELSGKYGSPNLHKSEYPMSDCPGDDCGNCTHGFMGVDELKERARYIPNFAEITTNQSFPDLKISEDGFVVKLTFTAQQSKRRPPPLSTEYPQLIILPSDFRSEEAISCSNDRVHCLNSSTPVATEYPNVYESAVTPPVPVKVGNYIAVHHPPDDRPALRLTFVRIPPVVPVTITSSEQLPLHPLVHLHIEQDRAEDSNIGVIAGGAVGGVLALVVSIVIATLIVAVVVLRSKNRGKVTTAQIEGTTNPVYGTNSTSAAELTNTGENTLTSQIYAEPNTRNDSGDVATRPDAQYSVATEQSAQFDNTTGHIDAITNAEYFLTTTVNVVTENHYECAVYVPTKEQREQLSPSEVNVYATLEEAQVGRKKEKLSFFDECEIYWDPAPSRDGLYAQLANRKYREIPSSCIRETGHLGSGEFGTVNRGVWLDGARSVDVAIKKLKDDCCEEEAVRFLQEAAIMGQFRHPNIVQLLGVVTIVKPVMIVTELAHNGNLREYLLSKFSTDPGELPPPETGGLLSQFCVQVARGMEYLSGKAFVHRDLAARNILVTDSKTCKISDFGLSRDLDDSYYVSRGGQIPIKWTAPEALHYKKYSTASDVWSFGCLMYEIWSLGHKPFEGYTNPDTLKLIDNGCRLAPPPGCPLEMYRLMITCWNADKSCRPQFREIVETLSQPESLLLHIPEEVTRGHPQASVLGAPLEAGRNLYTELQNTYM